MTESTAERIDTTARAIRIDDEDWTRFGEQVRHESDVEGGRSSVVRRLIRLWMLDPETRRKVRTTTDPVFTRNRAVSREAKVLALKGKRR